MDGGRYLISFHNGPSMEENIIQHSSKDNHLTHYGYLLVEIYRDKLLGVYSLIFHTKSGMVRGVVNQ